jgi:hypothetical protein
MGKHHPVSQPTPSTLRSCHRTSGGTWGQVLYFDVDIIPLVCLVHFVEWEALGVICVR